jgi:hypothetical protein
MGKIINCSKLKSHESIPDLFGSLLSRAFASELGFSLKVPNRSRRSSNSLALLNQINGSKVLRD